ncbi:hypothetical protein LBSG162_23490 [Lentilactobacillus buchneri subsp. silagei]|uniref:NUMOD4 domain-containing protein n=1 Tax=Lentilactobacillus TaxID=2767893 RepID=UPI00080B8A88|nr:MULTISPECIES: NUMOD4 domain-containing protein [Lentilactobacillus]MBW0223472.1 NUMOD4 motif-containing HNH endonuclease [Lentilactobacillus parabuchneri]OCB82634.1 hypothetical protein A7322_01235 [Lentilactobacillus parabuchneri]BEJ53978.1 hypothetical protein Ltb232_21540 [Lentilactobacillus buchneri subsp. silagei]GED93244.1 hypothetical protein LBSG162_23490 [Lentilactobacillus buchneri subsp. silagei]
MNKEWKDIPGYEGMYQINIRGQVKSLARVVNGYPVTEKLLKPTLRTNHYVYGLCRDGHVRQCQLHILVAETFNREIKFKNLNGEIWHQIVSDNHLEVSNFGRIRTRRRTYDRKNMTFCEYRLIESNDNGHGYQFIKYMVHGKNRRLYVHRVVAQTFIPNPNHYEQVNHIDGNKANNAFSNLEWVTAKQNTDHALNTGLMPSGTRNWNAKLDSHQLSEFWRLVYEGGYTTGKLMKHFGLNRHSVLNILNHKTYIREGVAND